MVVKVHKNQLNWFRQKARENDKEIFAVLAGKVLANGVEVHQFIHPAKDDYEIQGRGEAVVSAAFINAADKYAKERGLTLVGTIHTHINWPPIMSPSDHKDHCNSGWEVVSGIVEVTNRKTRVVFWTHDSSLRCTLKYFS